MRTRHRRSNGIPSAQRFTATLVVVAVTLAVTAAPASATWSIVGVDPDTGEVGAAIASCVPVQVVGEPEQPLAPVVLIPGQAAAVTQGQINMAVPARMSELLRADADPGAIIDDVTSEEFDEIASTRQHALVVLDGDVAAFTGADNNEVALDRQGPGVSVQGNLMVSAAVVDDTLARFVEATERGDDLADALAQALLAGSRAGGDRRCPTSTALFAQVVVVTPDDDPVEPTVLVTAMIAEGDEQNPVELMAASVAEGNRGVIDASSEPEGSGGVFRVVALVMAIAALGAGGLLFWRGLGSVGARR